MPWDNTYYGQTHPIPPEPKPAFNWNQPAQQPAYTPPQSNGKPWYERMAEMDSAAERETYLKGVFGPPPPNYGNLAVGAAAGYAFGWGIKEIWRGLFGRRRAASRLGPNAADPSLGADAEWAATAERVATAESDTRMLLNDIDLLLEAREERGTSRARAYDQFIGSFEARVRQIWSAVGARDTQTLLAVGNQLDADRETLVAMFADEDDD